MAGNKIHTKTKGREDKSKTIKHTTQSNEDCEESDFALLRKPVHTSVTGFAQARRIFDFATEELKSLLSDECDLLYECKVCRNIFRSLANLISHKRIYCKEKFSSSLHSHFMNTNCLENEILKIKRMEEGYQKSLVQKNKTDDDIEIDDRIPLTKDLTEIVENINKTKGISESDSVNQQVILEKIPSSSIAVFQSINFGEEKQFDKMRSQVKELENILSQDRAVLQSDGKFQVVSSLDPGNENSAPDNIIQISDDDEDNVNNVLKCKICDLQFSTQKTLKFHMKYKHLESRLVYPCPDCFEIFSTSWSVYRHLFKVHRKTAAQIRRLRESIQAKAFRMNNPPAFYEKRKNNTKPIAVQKISEEERLDQENQAWMDNMEGDGELPRCGGCGRTFERRAALASHTHTCQPRSRALARRPQENKKIEIQIRKDYNKGPTNINLTTKNVDTNGNKCTTDGSNPVNKLIVESEKNAETKNEIDKESSMDIDGDQKDLDLTEKPDYNSLFDNYKPVIHLPFAQHIEKNNFVVLKQKIKPEVDINKILCKKCDTNCNNVQELFEHMAGHYKWMRYACKLCNFKNYDFEKLPEHVKIVHKLKGDTDFYFSTLKPIDGNEALELSETVDEINDENESPDSRRPSRCSSDSSRLSDESSSSSTRLESGSRKRKIGQNKNNSKKKKECQANVLDDAEESKDNTSIDKIILGDNEPTSNIKSFEENSSDMDDIEEKLLKRSSTNSDSSVASRRPVRKKTKLKNEDFEYDLSNLLKMEAQGYRDSQTVASSKSVQGKKKTLQDLQINYDNVNKDHSGALALLSRKAVDNCAAHIKTSNFAVYSTQKERTSVFIRPMLPKGICKGDKISPKKDSSEDLNNVSNPNKPPKTSELVQNLNKEQKIITKEEFVNMEPDSLANNKVNSDNYKPVKNDVCEAIKTNLNIPAVVPIKFRRQSLEVIKNPIINKNITDFTKAGMKTKILVIKPINRNKDGIQTVNTPLKFQTIKLKDPSKPTLTEEKCTDQVVVVKVPKVDCSVPRSVVDTTTKSLVENIDQKEASNTSSNNNNTNSTNSEKTQDHLEITKPAGEEINSNETDEGIGYNKELISKEIKHDSIVGCEISVKKSTNEINTSENSDS